MSAQKSREGAKVEAQIKAGMIPWEIVAVQFDPLERALYDAAFAGARSRRDLVELRISGRRFMVAPSGKVWLLTEEAK